jgi:uncharacterized membrane protein
MRARSILLAGFLLSFLFVFCIVLTEPFGECDPTLLPIQGVNIQGAHIVSAGAYFRFWIFNNYTYPINVTINGADTLSIPSRGSIDYDVIAPQIFTPYEKVTYTFVFSVNGAEPWQPVNYTVLVLNSSFVPIFDLTVSILIAAAAIILVVIAFVILKRRRSRIGSLMFLGVLFIISGIEVIFIFASGVMDQPLHLERAGISRVFERNLISTLLSASLIVVGIIILILWRISFSHKPTESQK